MQTHVCNTHTRRRQVESKYGESISVKDITGRNPVKKKRRNKVGITPGDRESRGTTSAEESRAARLSQEEEEEGEEEGGGVAEGLNAPPRRKAPTDSSNVAFEEWLRGRRPRDFLAEQVRRAWIRVEAVPAPEHPPALFGLMGWKPFAWCLLISNPQLPATSVQVGGGFGAAFYLPYVTPHVRMILFVSVTLLPFYWPSLPVRTKRVFSPNRRAALGNTMLLQTGPLNRLCWRSVVDVSADTEFMGCER